MIFQTDIILFNRIHSLKYQTYRTLGSKDIGIRKLEYVAKTQFLLKHFFLSLSKRLTTFLFGIFLYERYYLLYCSLFGKSFYKCYGCKMSCLRNVFQWNVCIYEMSYIYEMSLFMKSLYPCNVLIYEMYLSIKCLYLWNVFIYEMYLWNVFIYDMSLSMKCLYLWNVLFIKCPVHDIYFFLK